MPPGPPPPLPMPAAVPGMEAAPSRGTRSPGPACLAWGGVTHTGWGFVPSLQQARSNRSACVGGKTPRQMQRAGSIQRPCSISTSPPCSVSAPDPLRAPQDESWLQKDAGTRFLPARVGLFVGWEELRVPAGVARAGAAPSLREFRSLGERDKGDGKHGGCCGSGLAQTAPRGRERDGERHLSVPHPGVFLRGFPRALPGSPAPSQRRSWGLALLLHTRTVLGP